MLYDPKWENLYTLERFAAWLAEQPADMRYSYVNGYRCAAAQYLQANGIPEDQSYLPPAKLKELGWNSTVIDGPWTFGAASKRAQRALDPGVGGFFRRLFGVTR